MRADRDAIGPVVDANHNQLVQITARRGPFEKLGSDRVLGHKSKPTRAHFGHEIVVLERPASHA